jgi:hypothetical protein
MHRRSVIQGLVSGAMMAVGRAVGLGAATQGRASTPQSQPVPAKAPTGAAATRPIQLHCDLAVDPKREAEMLKHFETVFKPTAAKQKGFIDLKMDKLNTAVRGPVPPGGRFRFVLTFESEALRQVWINSADHARVWPPIEDTLTDKNFGILVYDVY